jgi:alanine dehydrogenase
MSEFAGLMSMQVGTHYLEKKPSSSGLLLFGVPDVIAGMVCFSQQKRCG